MHATMAQQRSGMGAWMSLGAYEYLCDYGDMSVDGHLWVFMVFMGVHKFL